jgi:hypothetical protein
MNSIGALILAFLAIVVLFGPRPWALMGMAAGVLYLTQAQAINVLAFNLFATRFLELIAFIRVMARREFSFSQLNKVDVALIVVYSFTAIVYCLRESDGQAYMIGGAVDAFLCYFAFRGLIGDLEDLRRFLRFFPILLAPYAMMVLSESATHHNAFAFIGGGMYDWTRGDRFRCVGSFRSPDLLGTLGASFLPLYIGLGCARSSRKLACLGAALCMLIVWASNSGGPLCTSAVGIVGWMLWKLRTKMRKIRWLMVGGIALAALVMKAPVWYLLAKISAITGGDGWHRSYLMDVSFQHLGMWWLNGMPIIDTSDWFPYTLDTGADITNQFISFGLNAGLGAIGLFILLLKYAFSDLGSALAVVRSDSQEPPEAEFLLWGLGVVLAEHIANWFGITYFDQIYVIWYMQLAAISSVSASYLVRQSHANGTAPSSKEAESSTPVMQEEMPQSHVRDRRESGLLFSGGFVLANGTHIA